MMIMVIQATSSRETDGEVVQSFVDFRGNWLSNSSHLCRSHLVSRDLCIVASRLETIGASIKKRWESGWILGCVERNLKGTHQEKYNRWFCKMFQSLFFFFSHPTND